MTFSYGERLPLVEKIFVADNLIEEILMEGSHKIQPIVMRGKDASVSSYQPYLDFMFITCWLNLQVLVLHAI